MTHHEAFFTNAMGNVIFTQSWHAEGNQPQAIVIVVHGLGEHSGRYQNLIHTLIPHNITVYGLDHTGHGKSEGKRVYLDNFDEFINTLDSYVDHVKKVHSECPLYLVGHSMGGLITSTYLLQHQSKLSGAVLSAPAIQPPAQISPLLIKLGKYIAAIAPALPAVALDIKGISRDPSVIERYLQDPLVHSGNVTAGLSRQIQLAMDNMVQNAHLINLPLLILQGTEDRLVNPQGANFLINAVSSTDKTLKQYDGLYHELFNEPEKEQVLKDLDEWLALHIARSALQ
ncbi:alpha/beta hydrolase [Photobacterium sanguinicancri]|uniref:alpha/beta hydrolase n=1 Tax=Photobacterium sanguinicancri TaxID=875932 RepID=UPI0026E3CFB0|nr:alpha/beta hydrolase [Photobacterium sanguinicancri]MDO6500678.1 alpha/beta hydrolase [Photobacterium sanguinicancri]